SHTPLSLDECVRTRLDQDRGSTECPPRHCMTRYARPLPGPSNSTHETFPSPGRAETRPRRDTTPPRHWPPGSSHRCRPGPAPARAVPRWTCVSASSTDSVRKTRTSPRSWGTAEVLSESPSPRRPAPHCWKPPRTGHAGSPDVTGPVRGGGHVHRCTRADRSPRPEDTQGPTPAPGSSRQWPPNHRPPDPKRTKRSVGATPTATRKGSSCSPLPP